MRSGAMEGPRTLHTMIPSYTGTFNNGTRNWEVDIDSATGQMSFGWQVGGNNTIVYETYFDLDGYSMDDLTFFPLDANVQEPGIYSASLVTPSNMLIMDIMCTERLPLATLENMLLQTNYNYNNAPGMPGSTVEWSEITFGTLKTLGSSLIATGSTGVVPYIVQSESAFGSGHPVVAHKLWCYRFVYCAGSANTDRMTIPACRFLLTGEVSKEKDLVYINRLKNSYEVQGAV